MRSPHKDKWIEAMELERQAHEANGSFSPAVKPPGTTPLGLRWVFKIKYDDCIHSADRKVARFKARLVIQGHKQRHGVDYDEVYAPVLRKEVLRTLLTLGAVHDYEIHSMDVITAFLNGQIDMEVYVKYPPGYRNNTGPNDVLRVNRSVYGLKQAPRLWYQTLTEFLISEGYKCLIKDQCVFTKLVDGKPAYIGVYVDDIILLAPTMHHINTMKQRLSSRFRMHDLGELRFLLGIHVVRDRTRRTITLHQQQYATRVLKRYGYDMCNPHPTPTSGTLKLSSNTSTPTPKRKPLTGKAKFFSKRKERPISPSSRDKLPDYAGVVGSLMYLMVCTRPDLSYLVQQLSQFLSNPGPDHRAAAVKGLRYLKATANYGIVLGGQPSSPILHAYSDSDYANCPDTRRCVGGYITFLHNSPISWVAKRMRTVVLSTTEAELMILCSLVQECLYLKHLLGELHNQITEPIPLYEDNQSTILIVRNSELHGRSKHIDVRYHFIQQLVQDHTFVVHHVESSDQVADIFTKHLSYATFVDLRQRLRVQPHDSDPDTSPLTGNGARQGVAL